ncbi:MAG TPA: hypothetical protein VM598_05645 [Bdellovibrionota bacterium]|nr:hypothetical protein [Bdellovibrionota bacterium]
MRTAIALNATAALGLNTALGAVAGNAGKLAADLAANLVSGNSITRLQLSRKVASGLEVGARTYYELHPGKPLDGFTRPIAYAAYRWRGQELYADQQGNVAAEVDVAGSRLTLGYDGRNHDFAWSLATSYRAGRGLTLNTSVGQGSSTGNVNLPSQLARPSTSGGASGRPYFRLGGSWDFGRSAR